MAVRTENINIDEISNILFESAAEGLVVADEEGTIQVINPRVTEMFGFTREELIGKKVELLIPTDLRKRHITHRERYNYHSTKRSMGIGMDLVAQRKDGVTFAVEVSLNYFFVKKRKMVMALISDVTERKKTDMALQKLNIELEQKVAERTRDLRKSQYLYRLISRNFPNGIINVFDSNLNYVFVEGQELYRLGINSERLVGTNYLERLAPEVREDIKAKLMQVFEGENDSFEISFREHTYMINAVGLADEKGNISQILVVEQNITRFKKAEEDIREALDKERQLSELKSRFVSMASHEFRTPLTTIQSSLSLLKKYIGTEGKEDRQEKHIQRIKSSVHNLTSILNDFLSIDKLEEGRVQVNLSAFDPEGVIRETLDEMKQMAKERQQILYEHEGEGEVVSDKQMLRNILHNLVSNAIKYSPEGSRIQVKTSFENDHWQIRISDNGIGIPEAEQKHLFDRFFRARNVTNIQGTGLGLSITAKYVDLLEGHISFESVLDEGTTFIINLPILALNESSS